MLIQPGSFFDHVIHRQSAAGSWKIKQVNYKQGSWQEGIIRPQREACSNLVVTLFEKNTKTDTMMVWVIM